MTDSWLHSPISGDRFDRHELIKWWDQNILREAKILVIGAGAIGNEILKNLALLGVGNIFLVDFDIIENSNLSRSVLFHEEDVGSCKTDAAARAVKEMYPDITVESLHGNAVYDLGLGVFWWADIVLCGLDNREARLETSRKCWKTKTPLIDGGIEKLDGQIRMFVPPDGPCYECTMSELDWKLLAERRSCTLLTRDYVQTGHVPTTVTAAAIIAAIQCQEAIKWLHGTSMLAGMGLTYNGTVNELYTVIYEKKKDCLGHEMLGELIPLGIGAGDMQVRELLSRVESELGPGTVVEMNYDLLEELQCPYCHEKEEMFVSLGKVKESQLKCPSCRKMRIPHYLQELNSKSDVMEKTLAQIGVPAFDILTARNGSKQMSFFFDADAEIVLGELPYDK